ncbi:MAG TPA: transporter substrate-binding domain-containing protein [Burkholderiaceae bacterium]|jgi:polar amino acid transport system substrate-binding protein|nr:transporter substrate-binding domain-containing protein [Burkholderiaceae bacterium]
MFAATWDDFARPASRGWAGKRWSHLLLCAILLFNPSAHAVELVTEDGPPYNIYQNGKITGISTDKLTEAFNRVGEPLHIQVMPWARAYQSALTLPNYCVYSTARTTERETHFKWVGPLAVMDWVILSLADNPEKITSLEDLRHELIGGYRQDVISSWLLEQGYNVDLAATDGSNPQKLVRKRFKYWASSRLGATTLIANEGLTGRIVPVLTFRRASLYLACNLQTPDPVLKKLNDALHKLDEDGSGARIEARYVH